MEAKNNGQGISEEKNNRRELSEKTDEQQKMAHMIESRMAMLRRLEGDALNNRIHPEFVSCDQIERTLVLRAKTEDWMKNPMNSLHGGISASYLDFAMGVLCFYFSGTLSPTIHMEQNFLRPIPTGEPILIRSHLVKPGISVCFAEAQICLESDPDNPCVTGSGTYFSGKGKG